MKTFYDVQGFSILNEVEVAEVKGNKARVTGSVKLDDGTVMLVNQWVNQKDIYVINDDVEGEATSAYVNQD